VPNRAAGAGEVRLVGSDLGLPRHLLRHRRSGVCHFRQAEVEDLGLLALSHEQVCGFDVAVDDADSVRRVERVGNLDGQVQNAIQGHRVSFDTMLQGGAFQQLHHQEVLAFVLVNVVNGADVRVIQGGGGTRLALKTLQRLQVLLHVFRQKLQRHFAAEAKVLGLVHHAHAAPAQFLQHAVMRNGLPDHCSLSAVTRVIPSRNDVDLLICGVGAIPRRCCGC